MRGGNKTSGYTIVEVMIFLAVSGMMFVIAAGFISGRQQKTQFRQGINEFNSQVQQVISDVSNGYYPSSATFTCVDSGTGIVAKNSGSVSTPQGGNKGCVFMGKVIQFAPSDGATVNTSKFNVLNVIGRQFTDSSSLSPPLSYKSSMLTAYSPDAPNLLVPYSVHWGVQIDSVRDTDGSQVNGLGFYSSLASGSSDALNSGAQTVYAVPVNGPINNTNTVDALAAAVNNQAASGSLDSAVSAGPHKITVCLSDGGTQFGKLIFGGDNAQRLTSSVKITNKPQTGDVCA